jgi:hypothetical protein
MIQVYRIPVPKDRLRAMPKDERVLLLLLGYAANQLSMLQKLLNFATNRTPEAGFEQHATGSQTQMLVRLLVGSLNEAWLLISTRFLQQPFAKEYLAKIDADGLRALDVLKRQFGGSNLLNAVRNSYAFHYPRTDEAEAAFDAAYSNSDLNECWNLYFSQHGFNSSFFLSDLIFIHGISGKVPGATLEVAQRKLMREALAASSNLIEFAKAFFAAAWLRHFGAEILAKDVVTVADAPDVDQVWLPFFVEVPPGDKGAGNDAR